MNVPPIYTANPTVLTQGEERTMRVFNEAPEPDDPSAPEDEDNGDSGDEE